MKIKYCPYCGTRLPLVIRVATATETELTGQHRTVIVKECPKGCMQKASTEEVKVK